MMPASKKRKCPKCGSNFKEYAWGWHCYQCNHSEMKS